MSCNCSCETLCTRLQAVSKAVRDVFANASNGDYATAHDLMYAFRAALTECGDATKELGCGCDPEMFEIGPPPDTFPPCS